MKRFKIVHKTQYDFPQPVQLLPHTLRVRPREGHDSRIESSKLTISPEASIRWHRDVEENSIAIASFKQQTKKLTIESEIIIQKFDTNPHDFLIADYAVNYPFSYTSEDIASLTPYMVDTQNSNSELVNWVQHALPQSADFQSNNAQTFALLVQLNQTIFKTFTYAVREEEGVQTPSQTFTACSGSCRDFANLFLQATQYLGFASRFVSGYVYAGSNPISGATHAWTEVFIPGAGWKGFDPTLGIIVGAEHIATAVARLPELVPPVSGSYYGNPDADLTVDVWVTEMG